MPRRSPPNRPSRQPEWLLDVLEDTHLKLLEKSEKDLIDSLSDILVTLLPDHKKPYHFARYSPSILEKEEYRLPFIDTSPRIQKATAHVYRPRRPQDQTPRTHSRSPAPRRTGSEDHQL